MAWHELGYGCCQLRPSTKGTVIEAYQDGRLSAEAEGEKAGRFRPAHSLAYETGGRQAISSRIALRSSPTLPAPGCYVVDSREPTLSIA